MKCHTNVNSTPFTQMPQKFSYIVAILGHNHFESPNIVKYVNHQDGGGIDNNHTFSSEIFHLY
jgi:hypothetical protein